jgi:heme exporter protein C
MKVDWSKVLSVATLVMMLVSLYLIFIYAPIEKTMGVVQKIFYVHVSTAWTGFLAFFVVFVSSIIFLRNGSRLADIVAYASAEIGVLFTTLTLITGPMWARSFWGKWWDWSEPRLVTALILWFLYSGYLILHRSAGEDIRRARFNAVYGIIAFLDVPIVFLSVRWYRASHPPLLVFEPGGLDASMKVAFFVTLFTFTLLYFWLLNLGTRAGKVQDELRTLKEGL